MRVRTALVTARSAPAHERAIRTLMDWQIEVDEAMFLGGLARASSCASLSLTFSSTTRPDTWPARPHVPASQVAAGVAS